MRDLTDERDAEPLLGERTCILLKHGAHCPISAAARDELATFADRYPEVPIYRVEVTEHRALSDALARRFGVPHASPQAFVLRDGAPVAHVEHFDITVRALEQRIAD